MPPLASRAVRSRRLVYRALTTVVAAALVAVTGAAGAHADTTTAADVWTFDNDPVGAVPAGCATPGGQAPATVTDQYAYHSTRSLAVSDLTSTAMTGIRCTGATRHGALLSLDVLPAQLPNGFIIDVYGHLRAISAVQPVFHLLVDATGRIRWYDGSAWITLASEGSVTPQRWNHLQITAPADDSAVHVWVDGRYVGEGGPRGVRDVADLTGWGLTSDGTAPAGDVVYVDNATYTYADQAPPLLRHQPFDVSAPVTIDQSATPMQMPNTAVQVPHGDGQRILLSYPAHTDTSATSGNRFAYSDDAGAHWTLAQQDNPMPDVASYNMTRLPNGDVLAVSYHSYLVPGTDNTQATVESALSRDGGQTWTRRTGTLTTPQPIAPSSASDRPGVTMAALAWVHAVVADPDGTLYQSVYGYYAGDRRYRQMVMVSHDEGLTWTTRATIAVDPTIPTEGYCEGAIARTADGSLLVVMRIGSYQPMYISRSTDDGMTWTAPQRLLAGPRKEPVISVYPTMSLMPSGGPLVLLVGRPGLALLRSPDGSGHTWSAPQEADYQNSANGVFLGLDATHLLVFGDRGSNWHWPTPSPYQVWSRQVTVDAD